ncbi:VOC family protein [Agreia sp. COWG]|uniref:bleomycin resistance protein n=1 Tax=Agreia sp. COWG TaxID=2773266 RepID=UPI0019262958|nr:VOC family protein [Agreia sp. COWG]CAD6008786.1 Glyoxalase [Agreia sp. COWG]
MTTPPAPAPASAPGPEPSLVPELLVDDLDRSLAFWRDTCGFEVAYARPEERFAYIRLGSAHLMLEEIGDGRHWVTGPLEAPFGRGINFQISVPDAAELAASLAAAGVSFYLPLETNWYRIGAEEAGVEQFLVTDPDGYLVRFQSSLGRRPSAS